MDIDVHIKRLNDAKARGETQAFASITLESDVVDTWDEFWESQIGESPKLTKKEIHMIIDDAEGYDVWSDASIERTIVDLISRNGCAWRDSRRKHFQKRFADYIKRLQ